MKIYLREFYPGITLKRKSFVNQFEIYKASQKIKVGKTGFEPAAPWSQTRCATGLRYFPDYFLYHQNIGDDNLMVYSP